ncbi:MAG TPA: formate dehydrogenase accessory sulfurtransferase FdhD [bacterium]|nr:formate dehydrogenase accessory sulfurtransferase FdhD [bacterium]
MKEKIEVTYIDRNVRREEEVCVIAERSLVLRVNGSMAADFLYTPGDERELVAGHCFAEGWISGWDDVVSLEVEAGRAEVVLRKAPEKDGNGKQGDFPGLREEEIKTMVTGLEVTPGELSAMLDKMEQAQALGEQTRASHAVSLFARDGRMVVVREDAGRHNAFDKAIGFALMRGEDMSGMTAVLSSRISYEMALKAYRAGIQIMAGVSAATALAVKLGRAVDLTIAGRLRGDSMLVYSGGHRIV